MARRSLKSESKDADYTPARSYDKHPENFFASGNTNSAILFRQPSCACGGGCPSCQTKGAKSNDLNVSQPGDPAEIEADRIADSVMRTPPGALQHKGHSGSNAGNDADSNGKGKIQRKTLPAAAGGGAIPAQSPAHVRDVVGSGGQPLDRGTRDFFEPRLGHDLGSIRVHTGSAAARSAGAVDANAYTLGSDIVFGPGQFAPETQEGRHLIAHELAHTIQADRGAPALMRKKGTGDQPEGTVIPPPSSLPGPGQVFSGQTPDGLNYYYFNPEDYLSWQNPLEHVLTVHVNKAFTGVTDDVVKALLIQNRGLTYSGPDAVATAKSGQPVPLSISLEFQTQIAGWIAANYPNIRPRPVQKGISSAPPVPLGGTDKSADKPADKPGGTEPPKGAESPPKEGATPGGKGTDRNIVPTRADFTVFEHDPALSLLYLMMMQHFTSLKFNDENRALASDGLTAAELESLIGPDDLRRRLTVFFTQGWVDFQRAGGAGHDIFGSLIERILEQYLRGNPEATANRLRIGHGIPETEILGIVHRFSGVLMYDEFGQPMRGLSGNAYRDHGYIATAVSEKDVRKGQASGKQVTRREEIDFLTMNMFLQTFGAQDAAMIGQAVDIAMRHIDEVAMRIRKGLPKEILAALGETALVLTGFMVGHAAAAFMMRSGNAFFMLVGAGLEIALRTAGYILGIGFLADTMSVLLEAGSHISRVQDDEKGKPTALSNYHLAAAAEPIRHLIINTAVAMGGVAFTGAVRSSTVKGAALRWGRNMLTASMLGLAEAVPATRGTGGGPGSIGAPARIETPITEVPSSKPAFVEPTATGNAPAPAPTIEAPAPAATPAATPAPSASPAPIAETPAAPAATPAPAAPVAETPAAPAAPSATPATPTAPAATPESPAAAMERRLIESYLADPTGNARLARIEQLQQTLRMVLEDRVTTSTPQGRLRQQEILATLRRQINALGGTFTPAPAPAPAAAPATPAATPAPAAAPVAPAAPAAPVAAPAPVLNPNAMVSVNPAGTIFYSQGTRYFGHTAAGWRQMTVAQAQALGARPAAFAAAAVIPTGVYAVEHPVLGEPRIVIRSLLGYRQARARLEQHMASAGQYAITEIQGWQRAHSQGPGLGVESGEAIRLAPEFVNQALQNRGVEQFLRDLRDWTLRDGDAVHMTTVTETHTGTLRLEAIEYRIEIRRAGSTIQVGDVRIEVMRDGTSRGAVRSPGSETYTYTPAYDVSGNPVR